MAIAYKTMEKLVRFARKGAWVFGFGGYVVWRLNQVPDILIASGFYNLFVPGCFSECTRMTCSVYQGVLGEGAEHTRLEAWVLVRHILPQL